MKLDHVTLVAPDCRPLRDFFVEVAGMTSGSRPPFGVDGYWLYLGDQAVVHLIDNPAGLAPASASRATTRIDHVALRVESPAEWRALHGRLRGKRRAFLGSRGSGIGRASAIRRARAQCGHRVRDRALALRSLRFGAWFSSEVFARRVAVARRRGAGGDAVRKPDGPRGRRFDASQWEGRRSGVKLRLTRTRQPTSVSGDAAIAAIVST